MRETLETKVRYVLLLSLERRGTFLLFSERCNGFDSLTVLDSAKSG